MDVETLIERYNALRTTVTGGRPGGASLQSVKDVKGAEKFLDWCAEEEIEPIEFMESYCRFQFTKRGFFPRVNSLRSKSPVVLDIARRRQYRKAATKAEELVAKRAEARTPSGAFVRGLRRLAPYQEKAREAMIGKEALCLVSMNLTGGYDPRSRVCIGCPLAVRCSAELNRRAGFDVAALRAGRLDQLPKAVASAAVR